MKFFKTTLLTSIALSFSIAAQAKPFTNADAIDEAEGYKMFCNNAHDPSVCKEDQERFTSEDQNAYASDYNAQKDTAYSLWKGP